MGIVVQKFGGTSVADSERIRVVADRVVETKKRGNDVVVVVSAMGKSTDNLVDLAFQVCDQPAPRELDMLLTAGERVSIALLCMAVIDRGVNATSFTGSQAGILTDAIHGKAKILEINAYRVREALEEGKVPVIAGFQGVSTTKDVTTLGRGGSDTSAVAMAAALGASVCEIYTDVDGVYTADPRRVPSARKLSQVSHEEMLEMAAAGAGVLQVRSVEVARNYGVPVSVRSSFVDVPGTWIVKEEEIMERAIVSGVAHDVSEAKMTVRRVPDRPGVAAIIFRSLADAAVNVDMIVQNVSLDGYTDVSFTLPKTDLPVAHAVLNKICKRIDAAGYDTNENIAKISIVGAGMKTHPGVAADMFTQLAEVGVNIDMISTSTIRLSCVIAVDQLDTALQAIHDHFELEKLPKISARADT